MMMDPPAADMLQPFQLDASNLRGRLVRLGPALDHLLSRHAYPEPVAHLLAETLTLATLLAGMMKYDGVFTLQAQGSGAVSLLVADVSSDGALRACARFDPDTLARLPAADHSARALLGSGQLAFTVDQGDTGERYQGLVELEGTTLADFARAYFRRSEQIDTAFSLAASHAPHHGWQAGGLMLQRLPTPNPTPNPVPSETSPEDDWRRAMLLMATLTPHELTDPDLPPHDLLFRLFHEEAVRVYPATALVERCRCSRERIVAVLRTLPPADETETTADGCTEVRCAFCNRLYRIRPEEMGTRD